MFARDRDLLVLEPGVFREVAWLGQRLVRGVGSVSGTAMTMTSQDTGFDEAEVGEGHVVVIEGVALEVLSRTSGSELQVSRLRASDSGAALGVGTIVDGVVEVSTFAPQLAIVHEQVARMLGLGSPGGAAPTEADVVNPEDLRLVEALGALHLVYAAASAAGAEGMASKAAMYRERFSAERQRVVARVDLDGDGAPDAVRRMNVVALTRG
ncbi:MAG: hypothetical protein ACIARR_11255 [Phycisphaerales bacterium JB059]